MYHRDLLGPLLFVAYINDFDTTLKNVTVLKYADGIKLYLGREKQTNPVSYKSFLQTDLDTIQRWTSVSPCILGGKNPAFTNHQS